jgi:HEAT repeat protein
MTSDIGEEVMDNNTSIERLIALTQSQDAGDCAEAALELGRRRDPQVVRVLTALLTDQRESVVTAAAYALGQIGTSEAIPILIQEREKWKAICLGGYFGRAGDVFGSLSAGLARILPLETALNWLQSDDVSDRRLAAFAFRERPALIALDALVSACADDDRGVRELAEEALRRLANRTPEHR